LKKGLSQEELAHRADIHTAHLGRIERGEKNPTLETIEKIANALEITFEELFSFNIEPTDTKEPMIEKVVAYLKTMTIEEQKDVYSTIKMLVRWKNKS
jgi:transcriptional regulator with XRE-family HTH domain